MFSPLLQKFAVLEMPESTAKEASSLIEAVDDWEGFVNAAESHGLSALVLEHTNNHQLEIPTAVRLSLKALFFRHKAHADARYKVAVELLLGLETAGCPVLFLKGLVLSPLIYPSDAYRPMRDIDVLVARHHENRAARVIRDLGFELPDRHPDKFNRDSHQMPNAWKFVDGFKISIEIHRDAIERDAPGHLYHEEISPTRFVRWRDIHLETLAHEQMLHQLCRHLQGRQPGSLLKLINVADIVQYSEKYLDQIDWPKIAVRYPHVINSLRCLHLITPLSATLQQRIGGVNDVHVEGLGETMPILKNIVYKDTTLAAKLQAIFMPPDWWLHLFYDVPPGESLFFVKAWRHPLALIPFFGRRFVSRILGG